MGNGSRNCSQVNSSRKSNDGCYSKGVGRCQFADWIYSHFVLRIVFKHYFIILSCSVLAFEQLSAIDKNQKNYAVIDLLGVPGRRQASLIRRELSTVFLIPLLFPLLLTVLLIAGAQFFFGEAILQQGLVPLYGLVTILLFCAIYLTYFGATMFLFKRVILRPEMR